MKSHNKIILFLSLSTLTTNFQTAYGMRASKAFAKNSATLATGMLATYFSYDLYARREAINKDQNRIQQRAIKNPQPKTEAFVLETLRKAYPELQNRTIEVIANSHDENNSFAATSHNGIDRIYIPFGDKHLDIARECKSKHLGIPPENIAEFLKKKNITLSIPEYIAEQENFGIAMMPSTLDNWQWSILHEGSHITHNDTQARSNLSYAMIPIALLACVKSMQRFSAPLLLTAGFTTLATRHSMKYWQEYRADQQAIKRSEDPAVLKASSESFANTPKRNVSTLSKKMEYYLDPHPSNATRAAYLAQAANELEMKLAKD